MMKKYGLLGLAAILGLCLVTLGVLSLQGTQVNAQTKGEDCENGIDDDGDKLADCLDPDCDCTPTDSPCVNVTLDIPSTEKKVSLCHFTGGTNFVLNEPSLSAFEPHVGHHGDCWRFFDGTTGCAN